MDNKNIKQIKKEWLSKNLLLILCVGAVLAVLFACYVLFKHIVLLLLAIMLGFSAILIFRNNMAAYVESKIYKD